jgi:hypothetical protein
VGVVRRLRLAGRHDEALHQAQENRDNALRCLQEIKAAGYAQDPNYVMKVRNFSVNFPNELGTNLERLQKSSLPRSQFVRSAKGSKATWPMRTVITPGPKRE